MNVVKLAMEFNAMRVVAGIASGADTRKMFTSATCLRKLTRS